MTLDQPETAKSGIPQRASMETDQRDARIFGILFILTFLTSIPASFLFDSVLEDPAGYITGGGDHNQIYLAVLLEFALILANVGTAVVLYPIARRQNTALAIGYVAARIIECVFIGAGIIFVLGIVSLSQDSPDAADLALSLGSLKEWTELFGPGLIVPFGNGLILGYLMYKSGLVPRPMTWFGLIGGPILLIGNIVTLVDGWAEGSALPGLLVAPEFIWEAFLGIYCTIWGFRRDSPILQESAALTSEAEPTPRSSSKSSRARPVMDGAVVAAASVEQRCPARLSRGKSPQLGSARRVDWEADEVGADPPQAGGGGAFVGGFV